MFCPKCGSENPDNAQFCQNCGAQLAGAAAQPEASSSAEQSWPAGQPAQQQPHQPPSPAPAAPVSGVATGWTFAGFIPFGIFALKNGIATWGWIGLACGIACFIPVLNFFGGIGAIVYAIYIGINGKQLAWQNRQFASEQQYAETMKAWNMWGIILLIVGIVLSIASTCGMMAMMAAGGMESYY